MDVRSAVLGLAALVILLTAGAAQSLSGSNTVYSDDIVDNAVTSADLGTNSVTKPKVADNAIGGAEVLNNALTGSDINESTLSLPQNMPGYVTGLTSRTFQVEANPTGSTTEELDCPEGLWPVGGGGAVEGAASYIQQSQPFFHDDGTKGWRMTVHTDAAGKVITVSVLCADPNS